MTYYVQTYDVGDEPGQDGEWVTVARGLTLWQVRSTLRELYALGYSNVSIYVSQE